MAAQRYKPAPIKGWAVGVQIMLILLVIFATGIGVWITWAPVGVSHRITGGELIVETTLGFTDEAVRWPLNRIKDVRIVTLTGGWRTRGTARPGYCVGHFAYPNLGDVWQATTCAPEGVFIEREGRGPLVFTPADPVGFVRALRQGQSGEFAAAPGNSWGVGWHALKLTTLLMLTIPFFLIRARTLGYEVGEGVLRVRGPLGWMSFPLRGRRALAYTPPRFWRIFGIGMPGYWVGRFRDGAPLRAYASRIRNGVLLEGEPRVYVTPADIPGFLEALRAQGVEIG